MKYGQEADLEREELELFSCRSEAEGKPCVCSEKERTGTAYAMFNIACKPKKTTRDRLLTKLVRGKGCAIAIAATNGRVLYEHDCGVYPLHLTLPWIKNDDEKRPTTSYLEWSLATRAERIKNGVVEYATLLIKDGTAQPPPDARRTNEDGGSCGLPRHLDCCAHSQTARIILELQDGRIVPICITAADAIRTIAPDRVREIG